MIEANPIPNKKWSEVKVLITGVCGTIGSELARILMEDFKVGALAGVDNNETDLFFLEQRFLSYRNANFFLADVRDKHCLEELFRDVDIVFHAAAYKHVVLCERSPEEAVQTNILGTQNVIRAAKNAGVSHVVYTSSDKAVNPTNVMGASKLMGERLITAADATSVLDGTVFLSVRFGNVLGSRGSVVPIFHQQIKHGQNITLTDPIMTRFIMSAREAANLVINSLTQSQGGEIFITKMPVVQIDQLASVMIEALAPLYGREALDIKIDIIGRKPGEKMFEELMTSEEVRRTVELNNYFAVVPPNREKDTELRGSYPNIISDNIEKPYVSSDEDKITKDALRVLFDANGLLDVPADDISFPVERYWPDKII